MYQVSEADFRQNFPPGTDVPEELIKLLRYQNLSQDLYSGYFGLYDKFWHVVKERYFGNQKLESQFVFFGLDADGSIYAFWLYDNCSVNAAPVVFLGSEGVGGKVISNSLRDFLSLLSLGIEELGFALDEDDWLDKAVITDGTIRFRKWLQDELQLYAPADPKRLVQETRQSYPDLQKWIDEQINYDARNYNLY